MMRRGKDREVVIGPGCGASSSDAAREQRAQEGAKPRTSLAATLGREEPGWGRGSPIVSGPLLSRQRLLQRDAGQKTQGLGCPSSQLGVATWPCSSGASGLTDPGPNSLKLQPQPADQPRTPNMPCLRVTTRLGTGKMPLASVF